MSSDRQKTATLAGPRPGTRQPQHGVDCDRKRSALLSMAVLRLWINMATDVWAAPKSWSPGITEWTVKRGSSKVFLKVVVKEIRFSYGRKTQVTQRKWFTGDETRAWWHKANDGGPEGKREVPSRNYKKINKHLLKGDCLSRPNQGHQLPAKWLEFLLMNWRKFAIRKNTPIWKEIQFIRSAQPKQHQWTGISFPEQYQS